MTQSSLPIRFPTFPFISEQIRHCRGGMPACAAKWQATNSSHLLLELTTYASIDREMARVVRPRSQFVDQQFSVARQKHLDTKYTDYIKLRHDCPRHADRLLLDGGIDSSWKDCHVENVVAMY